MAKNRRKSKKPAEDKRTESCFVLMPFREPFNTYYHAIIKPTVEICGLTPLRGDSLFRPSPIMADVWAMIQTAKVLVAELTTKNPNVFYELGLAHAIGKPVVLLSETMDDVPFDLQPLRVLLYDKNDPAWGDKLKADLASALGETLPDPVRAVPSMFRKKVASQAPEDSAISVRLSELERQIATLSTKYFSFNPVSRSWVEDYHPSNSGSEAPVFRGRLEAISWAVGRLQAGDLNVMAKLREELGEDEARIVYDLAIQVAQKT